MSEQQQQPEAVRPSEIDGEEIQSIGYENAAELSGQIQIRMEIQAADKPVNDDVKGARSVTVREAAKKSKDLGVTAKLAEGGDVAAAATATTRSSSSSQNDICRICHMGNNGGSNSASVSRQSCSGAQLDLGLLVSACRCRGTVGLVHTKCLERWLTESGHTRCELCGYRYATIRVPRHGLLRSLLIWMRTFVATRQMLLDSLYLLVTTPLAVFSAYVCAMTLKMALDNRIAEIPWTVVAMLPTCSLTLVAYWGWLLTLQRLHGRRWRQYWQSNFIIRLLPDTPIDDDQTDRDDDVDFYQDDVYEDLPELFNLM